MRRFDFEQTAVTRRIAPVGDSTGFAAQVLAPLCQSLISGAAIGALAGVGCWAAWDRALAWPVGLVVGVIGFSATWGIVMADARSLLRSETVFPGGLPEKPADRLIPVIAPGANPQAMQQGERQERFRRFILACEHSTARRDLLREFSEGELEEFKAVLVRLGYARDRGADPRQGWQLTAPAAELLRAMCL